MSLPAKYLLALVALAGCGGNADCPALSVNMKSLAAQAAAVDLDVYPLGTSCDGNDVPAGVPAPLVHRRLDGHSATTVELPAGHYVLVLHAFDDAGGVIGSACSAELFTPGQKACLSMTLSVPMPDGANNFVSDGGSDGAVDSGAGGSGGSGGGGAGGSGGGGSEDMAHAATPDMATPPFTAQTSGTTNSLYEVWSAGGGSAFVVGTKGTILHTSDRGTTWTAQSSGTTNDLESVWGSSVNDVYVVGVSGMILHSINAGSSWSKITSPVSSTISFYDIWGAAAGDVYVVGDKGTVLHGSSAGFSSVSSGVSTGLQSVWGGSASDVFVFGGSGTILHGSASGGFTKQTSGTTDSLYFGWGSRGDVWINGVNSSNTATIYYSSNDGASWSAQLNTGAAVWALWSTPTGDAIAVGDVMLESINHGAKWNSLAIPPALLYGVGGDPTGADGVWSVGVSGTILHRP